jgi:hypothetical protein
MGATLADDADTLVKDNRKVRHHVTLVAPLCSNSELTRIVCDVTV